MTGPSGIRAALAALLLSLSLFAPAAGCRKSQPDLPPASAEPPPLEVDRTRKWLFTYVDAEGRFATTDDPEAVPAGSRTLVRVTDPAAGPRQEGVGVYVIDVAELLAKGKVTARARSREGFESGALAQLPPGESSLFPGLPSGAPAPGGAGGPPAAIPEPTPPVAGSPPAGAPPAGAAVVTLYGTAWCQACKAARTYLRERRIPFADKDIERDPQAARELREKAARLGVPADRVPVLDVRGRLLIGFDRGRLEALLGEAT